MTFFHETLHPSHKSIKQTILSLSLMVCLGAAAPSIVMGSNDPLSQSLLEEKKELPQTTHGYTPDVYEALSKRSTLLVGHDVIQTQISNNEQGNTFLHERTKKGYHRVWDLLLAQQSQFLKDSGLCIFDTTVNKKSVAHLENVSRDEWDSIKPKDVSLPKENLDLPLKNGETTSLSRVEEDILTDLAIFIFEKRTQNATNPLEHVTIKDLNASIYAHTDDTKKTLDETITHILQHETYNTLCLLMWQRALLDVLEKDINSVVDKSNAMTEGFKSRLGAKEKFNKASNTKEEIAIYQKDLFEQYQSLEKLLNERKILQQSVRDKMISFVQLLKAPKEDTTNLEKDTYGVWPVDGDVNYGGYLRFMPHFTSHGLMDSFYVNVFGTRHSRSIGIEETLHPLIDVSHVRQVFASFKKHVIKNDETLDALLMGHEVKSFLEQSHAPLHLETLFNMTETPVASSKESAIVITTETTHDNSEGEGVKMTLSERKVSDVNVGEIATKAGQDIQRILDNL